MRRVKALLLTGVVCVAFGAAAPADAPAVTHYSKKQCRQYRKLAKALGVPPRTIRKRAKQHGCAKKK